MFSSTSNLTTGEENTYPPEKYVKLMFNIPILENIACNRVVMRSKCVLC